MNRETVKAFMARQLNVPLTKLNDESSNLTDLVHESFILIELVIALQEEFQVRLVQDDLQEVKTLGQLLDVLQKKKNN
jgi:acyl carrier protein